MKHLKKYSFNLKTCAMTETILIIFAGFILIGIVLCIRWWIICSNQVEADLREEMTIIQQTESNDDLTN